MIRKTICSARWNRPRRFNASVAAKWLVALCACCLHSTVYARLGDRFSECIALYGAPVRVVKTATGKWAKFYINDVAVFASFYEDRCVEIEYLNMPGQALTSLLKANRGYGQWKGEEGDEGAQITWTRTDGAVAILDLANEPNALLMRSPEANKAGVKGSPWVLVRPGRPLAPY